jgi:response regulator RpfG family c-di-GMP phosphodiesterase
MTHKLLIVDDELPNLRLLERLFANDFQCLTASSGLEAIRLLEQHDVAILITDQRMPGMTGIELLKRTAPLRPHMVRILLTGYTDVEALVEAINSGLVYMYVSKPWSNDDLKLRVNRACEHHVNNKTSQALADANQRLQQRLSEIKRSVVIGLAEMLNVRDPDGYSHALRVCHYAMLLAARLDVAPEAREDLSIAALLYGLGDYAIPHVGSLGPRLLDSQVATAAGHGEAEARLLRAIPELANVAELIGGYRENFDGSGMPRGLSGEQISLPCRILRLAVEYDRMVRPKGSPPMNHDETMRFLTQRSGKQFDPMVVDTLAELSVDELGKQQSPLTDYGKLVSLLPESPELSYIDAMI